MFDDISNMNNVEALAQPTLITPPEVEATEIEQDLRLLAFVAPSKKRTRKR